MTRSAETGLYQEIWRLLRPFCRMTLLATAIGGVSGVATTLLLATINRGLQTQTGVTPSFALSFVGLCAITLFSGAIAGTGNSRLGQKVIAALRKDIAGRILCAPIAAIERARLHRLVATLNQDVDVLSVFTFNFSGYATAFAITLGCIAYLIFLSPGLFLLTAGAIAGGIAINQHARGRWLHYYQGVGEAQDDLHKEYRAITEGAKELRINRQRRLQVFTARLGGAVDRIADLKSAAMRLYWLADTGGGALFFLAIGVMLVIGNRLGIGRNVVGGFVIVMLYVKGPLEQVAGALPTLVQAQVAFRRVAQLMTDFTNREPHLLVHQVTAPAKDIRDIALRQVCYGFPAVAGTAPFTLGPIDLTIRRGETLFIVGENGSGKTTLVKLLLGLYVPSAGGISLDGEPVTAVGRDDYRQLFSAVFSDYFLFDEFADDVTQLDQVAAYLERLDIAHKVRVEKNAFTTTDLSTGQRRRLALVHAYLERRPVIMFDEWAADQDPTFRRIFYTELLPDLKSQGKTLIVVSHDDRYFHLADRIIRLDRGKMAEERPTIAEVTTGAMRR
jgi:putative pyoverdin transport system ATP-binding/permease protein